MSINFISAIKNNFVKIAKNIKKKPLSKLADKFAKASSSIKSPNTAGKIGIPPTLPSDIAKKIAACAAGVGTVGVASAVNSTTAKFDDRTFLCSTTAVNSTTAKYPTGNRLLSTTA